MTVTGEIWDDSKIFYDELEDDHSEIRSEYLQGKLNWCLMSICTEPTGKTYQNIQITVDIKIYRNIHTVDTQLYISHYPFKSTDHKER